MDEHWVAVIGYEGLYEVSDLGRVRSIRRPGSAGKVLIGDRSPDGYPAVKLSRDGRKKHLSVHGLVATAFHGPRPEALECRHLNGDPADNRAVNLAWGTSRENHLDTTAHGRSNSRISACPQGHEYTDANTRRTGGRRYCKECNRKNSRESQRRRRAKERA